VDEIDSSLESDALNAGESRDGNLRIVFAQPLAALVEVLPDEKTANVVAVWLY
jgi:hypothetical protein